MALRGSFVVTAALVLVFAACVGDSPVATPGDGGNGNDTGTTADSGQDATTDSSADGGSPADASDAGSDDGGIIACTSAASLLVTDTGMHHGIAVDGQNLYWANQSTNKIMKWPLAGGSAVPLASNLTLPTDVTVDGTYVYFADSTAGTITRMLKDGGSAGTIGDGNGAYGLSAQGSLLYVSYHDGANAGHVGTMPITGGAFTSLATGNYPAGAGSSPAGGYFTFGTGDVKFASPDGGSSLVAAGEANPYDVASDGARIYWTTLGGQTIRQAPADGGAAYLFVTAASWTSGVAVDAHCVYWTLHDGTGRIYTAAKQ